MKLTNQIGTVPDRRLRWDRIERVLLVAALTGLGFAPGGSALAADVVVPPEIQSIVDSPDRS